MRHFMLSIVLCLALAVAGLGQQPAAPPAKAPADPAAVTATQVAEQRSPTFSMFVGLIGIALVLLVVCYPSRRYG